MLKTSHLERGRRCGPPAPTPLTAQSFSIFNFIYLIIFSAALGLCFCVQDFSSCSNQGLLCSCCMGFSLLWLLLFVEHELYGAYGSK